MMKNGEASRTRIRALVFDAYGTLLDVHSVVAKCEECFPGRGQALSAMWRTKQLEYTWLTSLMGHYRDFSKLTEAGLRYACAALELRLAEGQVVELLAAYEDLSPFPEVRSALQAVSSLPLAVLSNGAPDMLNAVMRNSGLAPYFAHVISVDEVRVFKPDPQVYALAPRRLAVPREEIAFISSNGWDAAGAAAFGFRVFWVNRGGLPLERLEPEPEAILDNLSQLPARVTSR
jgi:2-haloacid dehalogenase